MFFSSLKHSSEHVTDTKIEIIPATGGVRQEFSGETAVLL